MPRAPSPDPRPYFDARWYATTYGKGRLLIRQFPWAYYRRRGWRKVHSPCRLFAASWYLSRHPDVQTSGIDPLTHYVTHGWKEGRPPHPLFDPSWYVTRYPDVEATGIEPLLHYVTEGWRQGRSPHPAFDAVGYVAAHPEVAASGVEPLAHYLDHGWRQGYRPHPLFDVAWYLERNPDVALAGIEPLTHFVGSGWLERRDPSPRFSLAAFVSSQTRAIEPDVNPFVHFLVTEYDTARNLDERMARAAQYAPAGVAAPAVTATGPVNRGHVRGIAMYLPQFHRVPENDAWWGEGFTEWTNVRRARPMFAGHQQPHVPHPDVGYYDLADETVLERQAEMARRHGIHGFCFYHYWFDGRRILEKPVERLLASGKPDIPFCLCWANENWTRTWDGLEREVLLEQRHSSESDERFFRDLLPALRDPRYITVEGRLLLAVYRPGLLAEPAATADRWRRMAEREGLPGLHLVAFHSFDQNDPRSYGFDAAVQFPPLQIPAANIRDTGLADMDRQFRGGVLDYREAMCHSLARPSTPYPLYRGVMPGWDNTPRRMERATAWINSSPELYGRWLRAVIDKMQREQPAEHQLVFINAWNEWAEGAHLEPDSRNGYRNLEETAAALVPQAVRRQVAASPAPTRPAKHDAVLRHRRARLRTLFGANTEVSDATHAFLLDHVAAVAHLARNGGQLSLDGGRPVCQVDGTSHALDTPAAVSAAIHAADMSQRKRFCFVVLQFNQPEVTARCVASLERLSHGDKSIHVIVVDNGSEPAAVARTRELCGERDGGDCFTLIFNDKNLGFAGGNNVGYRHARDVVGADFIAVINNDTVIDDPAFIEKCLKSFDERPWSVLGPDIVTPDGRHENPWNDTVYDAGEWAALGDLFEHQRAAWKAGGPAEFRRVGRRSPESMELSEPLLQGAAYVLSPVFVADHSRVFDERTFLYGEEFLLAVDCLLTGHLAVYDPRIVIAHEEGVSTAKVPERKKIAMGYGAVIETAAACRTRLERHEAATRGMWLEPDAPEIATLTGDGRTHVLVDLLFCQPGFHGGGEYGKAVFKALVAASASRGDMQVWAALNPALFIDGWIWETCREHAINIVAVKSYDAIMGLVNMGMFTSFFAPAIVVYTGYEYQKRVGGELGFTVGRTRVVGTLLDVRDLEMAEGYERIAAARRRAGCAPERTMSPAAQDLERQRQAAHARALAGMYQRIVSHPALDAVITISDYSAASIQSRIGTDRPLDVLFPPRKDRPVAERFAIPGIEPGRDGFALVVNAGRIEKNAASAVNAFDRLCFDRSFAAEHPRLKLVLVGVGSVSDLGLGTIANPDRFVALPHLPPEQLEFLYREAGFLLYPSFNEGFGYPPLEAMDHGTPGVIADNTSVPEVCGTAAVPCDPFDIDSVTAAIRMVLTAPPTTAELRRQRSAIAARQEADVAKLIEIIRTGREAARADSPTEAKPAA